MERSPEPSPPRARRSTLDLTLPMAPRLSHMSGSSVVYLDDSMDLTVEQPARGNSPQTVADSGEVRLSSSSWASDPAMNESNVFLTASPAPPIRRSFGLDTAAASLATQELAEIHSLIKLKSDRVAEQERALQRSSCAVAELTSIAQIQLRTETEALLDASQRELRKQVAAQRRRLDQAFLKTQEEFRKVVAWRREIKCMKESMATHAEETSRLTQRLNDAQRRCSTLAEREKAHRQALQDERVKWEKERSCLEAQWEKERSRLEAHHHKLRQEVDELREQQQQQEKLHQEQQRQQEMLHLKALARSLSMEPEVQRKELAKTEAPEKVPLKSSFPDHSSDRFHSLQHKTSSDSESDAVSPSQDYTLPMLGAWWSIDMMSQNSSSYCLWGYVFFLTEVMDTRTSNDLWELADCFIRKWSWQLLVEATRKGLLATVEADPSDDVENNAIAWARAKRRGTSVGVSEPPRQKQIMMQPFQLSEWPPEAEEEKKEEGPLGVLSACLTKVLKRRGPGFSESSLPHRNYAFLEPVAAQKQVASILWRSVRRQLLSTEDIVRNGMVDRGELAEAGRTLLAVAALSLPFKASDAESALRSLRRLCDVDEHCVVLKNDLNDALPVLLWIADVSGALYFPDNLNLAGCEICELVADLLLPLLRPQSGNAQDEISMLAMTLIRCNPNSPIAEPLSQIFCRRVAASNNHRRVAISFESRLQHWLQKSYQNASSEKVDRLASHLSMALRVGPQIQS